MRVAAVDCGTNSMRLLIAEALPHGKGKGGQLRELTRLMQVVRLGEDMASTGRISDAARKRAAAAAQEYAQLCCDHAVQRVGCVTTAAARNADNAHEVLGDLQEAFSEWAVQPEIISGEHEASLSFVGAAPTAQAAPEETVLVVDIGGGSTELVRGCGQVEASVSVPLGCVVLTQLASSHPLSAADQAMVDRHLAEAFVHIEHHVELSGISHVVGTAGTASTVAAHILGLAEYDSAGVHGARSTVERTCQACRELYEMTLPERRAQGYMHPGRADVIGVGARLWEGVLRRVAECSPGVSVVTSEHDILDGLARELLASEV